MAASTGMDPVRLSKTMSHALRHDPDRYGLALDAEGWVPVEVFLQGLRRSWPDVSRRDVENVVAHGTKQRFEVDADRIRARYGHSTAERVELPAADPPDVLFHGTGERTADLIDAGGLQPMGRQYVHLSPSRDTALTVGARHGRPVVFVVDARSAAAQGVTFRRGNDDTWLADGIEARFLSRGRGIVAGNDVVHP